MRISDWSSDVCSSDLENWRNAADPTANGVPIRLEPNEISRSVAVSADGSGFALGTDFYLRYVSRGGEAWRQLLPAPAWAGALSGDGRFALAALGDGTIRWDRRADGRQVLALFPHAAGRRWNVWTPAGFLDPQIGKGRGREE